MTYRSIYRSVNDNGLRERIIACAMQEAASTTPAPTIVTGQQYVQRILDNPAAAADQFIWRICLKFEAEYASALAGDVANPGSDEAVITDSQIRNVVRNNWPQDPVVTQFVPLP